MRKRKVHVAFDIELREVLTEADVNADVVAEVAMAKHKALSAKALFPAAICDADVAALVKAELLVANVFAGNSIVEIISAQVTAKAEELIKASEARMMAHIDAKLNAAFTAGSAAAAAAVAATPV
ncbi:hypothetical protein HYH03_005971 [Edaphochlamys debaryana]|uniref:Uncharacterized protein n=1 Tax=Edaphochlamys debaryana TaxID=47281 RepID=A0A835Y415_9CHLO|nr:hypothetical protein HYH03_005971 [Edaphochlamys debaryana]|eukprot:KAG2496052.1 hypothetical protein HYH03_005971 [Edaphochlamys debaryana]